MIDIFITTGTYIIDFLHNELTIPFKWQTLLGALLGPLLAVYASVVIQSRKDEKENIRRVEVSLTGILNDIYESREALNDFLRRSEQFVEDIESNNESYFVGRTNFPNKRIFLDEQLSNLKLHSLYLHNKLLWIEGGVRNIDISLNEMYESFTSILNDSRDNMRDDNMTPANQRSLLAQEFRGFSIWVRSLVEYYNAGIKMLAQAKVYNLMLKEDGKRFVIWKYEKLPIKYYLKPKKFKKEYISIFKMQERIDGLIESRVEEIINEAERRLRGRVER